MPAYAKMEAKIDEKKGKKEVAKERKKRYDKKWGVKRRPIMMIHLHYRRD